jgi:hypothetical protein
MLNAQRLAPALLLAAALPLSASAQVEFVETFKTGVYFQTSNDAPTEAGFWNFVGRVLTTFSDDLFSADLVSPTLGLNEPLSQSGSQWLWYSSSYPSRAALDASFPDSVAYAFDLFGPSAIGLATISAGASLFPSEPPHFSGAAWEMLQEVNPLQDIEVSVDSFEEVPGANDSAIYLDVYNLDFGYFVLFLWNPTDVHTFLIPAGTLAPDSNYVIRAIYSSRKVVANAFFGTADTAAAFDLSTEIRFHTRACVADIDGNPGIDLGDFFYFFNCFDASEPCADLDGDPGVDLGDFFAFFNGFDTGC